MKKLVRRPGLRDLKLSCAHCGHDHFRLHVRPVTLQGVAPSAKVIEAVCNQCEWYWSLNDGTINSSGRVVADNNPMKEVANG